MPIGKAGRKIIATTDKSLSLPLIPTSFIERWVNEQGKIDKVRVDNHQLAQYATYVNNEVIILYIEDRILTKEDMRLSWKEGMKNATMFHGGSISFDEWFNKTYPI